MLTGDWGQGSVLVILWKKLSEIGAMPNSQEKKNAIFPSLYIKLVSDIFSCSPYEENNFFLTRLVFIAKSPFPPSAASKLSLPLQIRKGDLCFRGISESCKTEAGPCGQPGNGGRKIMAQNSKEWAGN